MKQKINFLLILLVSALLIFFIAGLTKQDPKVIGWIPYWDQGTAFESFKQNADKTDYVSLFWYRIDENGNLGKYEKVVEDKSIIAFAKNHNVKVLALVANLSEERQGHWDSVRVDKVISQKEAREKHIQELVELVVKNDFDGIDIDYESLESSQRDDFSLFIEELSGELHKKNKILGVAIHPKVSEKDSNDSGSGAQDLRKIGRYADQLYFMTYLEHGSFSHPGPIGSSGWMEKVLRFGLSQAPQQKVFLGIGLMGSEWIENRNGEFSGLNNELKFADIYNATKKYKVEPVWDDASRSPYLKFQADGINHVVWYENAESIKVRADLARQFRIGGIALWRLGGEDQRAWSFIN